MYRITPFKSRNVDLFDMFDDFFNTTNRTIYRGNMRVDVQDLEKEYIVDVDVPGLTKDDLEVHFENERLIISVNKEEEIDESKENKYIHKERYVSSMQRSIYLKDVDPKKFKAKLDNGVLTITAQKQEDKISKYMIDID